MSGLDCDLGTIPCHLTQLPFLAALLVARREPSSAARLPERAVSLVQLFGKVGQLEGGVFPVGEQRRL